MRSAICAGMPSTIEGTRELMQSKQFLQKSIALALAVALSAGAFIGCSQPTGQSTGLGVKYDASSQVIQALSQLDPQKQATVLTGVETTKNILALTFDGFALPSTIDRTLQLLDAYDTHATFFVTGVNAAEDEASIQKMRKSSHPVESGTLYGKEQMEAFSSEELVEDFSRSSSILNNIMGVPPQLLKCSSTTYNSAVLSAAAAAGYSHVVESDVYISYQSFKSYEETLGFITRLKKGSIVSVKLSGVLNDIEYNASSRPMESAAEDPKPTISDNASSAPTLSEEERLFQVLEWLLKAMQESGRDAVLVQELPSLGAEKPYPESSPGIWQGPIRPGTIRPGSIRPAVETGPTDKEKLQYLQARTKNNGRLADEQKMVYTTEPAAALSFFGIENEKALAPVLAELKRTQSPATFFVSSEDIKNNPKAIRQIADAGHEFGAAILPKMGLDYVSACHQITEIQQLLQPYGAEVRLVKQVYNPLSEEVREAASAMGMLLVGHTTNLVRGADEYAENAQPIIDALFQNSSDTVKRGSILHMRLDFYKKSNTLAAEMIQILHDELLQNSAYRADGKGHKGYVFESVYSLLSSDKVYTYPLPEHLILPAVKGQIHEGYLNGKTDAEKFSYMQARYLGNPDVASVEGLPGFADEEIDRLDTTGKIDTGNSNTIFLTFDDWGTDKNLNHLLYVLEKHNVKATFFIRTQYVPSNPNLLRAIGEKGHEIASHTDTHMTLSNSTGVAGVYSPLNTQQVTALRRDLLQSYKTLEQIVGDMKNEAGRPVLTRNFRPPTLAMSRNGMEAIFDCGFSHSISGDISTGDYKAGSTKELFHLLVNGMQLSWTPEPRRIAKGSVIVLHLSDEAQYTPEAIDQFLTWNATRPAAERYEFARISDYLQ